MNKKRVKIIISTLFIFLLLSLALNVFLIIKINKTTNIPNIVPDSPETPGESSETPEPVVSSYVGKWKNGNLYMIIEEDNTAFWVEITPSTGYGLNGYVYKGKLVGDVVIADKELDRGHYFEDISSSIDIDILPRVSDEYFIPAPKTISYNLRLYTESVLYVDTSIYLKE